MTTKGLIVSWLLFAIVAFGASYLFIHVLVSTVMADFRMPAEPSYGQWLEVKPNYGTQTDQYTPIQPAKNVQAQ